VPERATVFFDVLAPLSNRTGPRPTPARRDKKRRSISVGNQSEQPSLIAAFGCSKSLRITGLGLRLLVTALIGAAIYLLLFSLFLPGLTGRNKHDWLLFTGYATGAGAISTFFCALIVEYLAE
jgi:hypothetical protein